MARGYRAIVTRSTLLKMYDESCKGIGGGIRLTLGYILEVKRHSVAHPGTRHHGTAVHIIGEQRAIGSAYSNLDDAGHRGIPAYICLSQKGAPAYRYGFRIGCQ